MKDDDKGLSRRALSFAGTAMKFKHSWAEVLLRAVFIEWRCLRSWIGLNIGLCRRAVRFGPLRLAGPVQSDVTDRRTVRAQYPRMGCALSRPNLEKRHCLAPRAGQVVALNKCAAEGVFAEGCRGYDFDYVFHGASSL
jgi:hypothetical protein